MNAGANGRSSGLDHGELGENRFNMRKVSLAMGETGYPITLYPLEEGGIWKASVGPFDSGGTIEVCGLTAHAALFELYAVIMGEAPAAVT